MPALARTIEDDCYNHAANDACINGGSWTRTKYGYNSANRLTSITYPTGRTVTYERNGIGQVAKVTMTVGATTTTVADLITHMPFGGIESYTLGNGVAVTRTYDDDYRITNIKDQGTGTIQHLDPDYDLRGNIEEINDLLDTARNQTFGYDALSRLTAAHGVYGDLAYTYDGVGNRETETRGLPGITDTYAYPAPRTSHHLQSQASGASFTYDEAGAVKTKGDLQLTYNNAHRANAITLPGSAVNNLYSAAGQRVKKVGDATTVFHYDRQGHLLAETDPASVVRREYVWLGDLPLRVDAVIARPQTIVDDTDLEFSKTGAWYPDITFPGYYGVRYLNHEKATISGTQGVDDDPAAANNTRTGVWYPLACQALLLNGCVGEDMHVSPGLVGQPRTFIWHVTLPWAGRYQVQTAWWNGSDRSTAAKYTIPHSAGTAELTVDQRTGGGQFVSIGAFDFAAGANSVSLTAAPSDGNLVADAVMFIPLETATGDPAADQARWAPPDEQTYEVYANWPDGDSKTAPSAMYSVKHAGGRTEAPRNQQVSAGGWSLLGTFAFTDLVNQGVFLSPDPSRRVAADAIRFAPAGPSFYEHTTSYFHVDHLGTPQKLTDESQNVVWSADYEPFGKATVTIDDVVQPLRFPGQYFDAETGLHQNWNRDYDPGSGRYLQSDPIGLAGGLSTYGYALNNPGIFVDPDGRLTTGQSVGFLEGGSIGRGGALPFFSGFGIGGAAGLEARVCCEGKETYTEFYLTAKGGPSFGGSSRPFSTDGSVNLARIGALPKCRTKASFEWDLKTVDIQVLGGVEQLDFGDGRADLGVTWGSGASIVWNFFQTSFPLFKLPRTSTGCACDAN